jgi:hypothetical protein
MTIFINARDSEENVHSDNYNIMAIDELYWFCREISSLISHRLNKAKLAARVQISNELLTIIRSAEHQGLQYFNTLDESWFDLSKDYEII